MATTLSAEETDSWCRQNIPGYQSIFVPPPVAVAVATRSTVAGRKLKSRSKALTLQRGLFDFGEWRNKGSFSGAWPALEWRGPINYLYTPDPKKPFAFTRSNKVRIEPKAMQTDGGSVPRLAWTIPGFSPWDFLPAYLIHDWDFFAHDSGDSKRSFEDANLALGEAIHTLRSDGVVSCADWKIEVIYRAVSSPIGRGIWDRPAGK